MNPKAFLKIEDLLSLCDLKPHPEGGFYKETYRSSQGHSTAIYYLLPQGSVSNFHRIKSDEVFHFYLGGPLTIVQISPQGVLEAFVLGQDLLNGQKLQHVVPGGYWFGAIPNPGTPYSLVSCTVAPAFEFKDFELGDRKILLALFSHARDWIEKLTPA